jgi:hypothetical protein
MVVKWLFPGILLCCFLGFACKKSQKAVPMVPLLKDSAFLKEYDDLLVIIGSPVKDHKINFDSSINWDGFMSDGVVVAKYHVHQWVYGKEAPPDTIEFTSYDHYGYFGFLKSEYAMLFLRKYEGKYYQEKYMYYDVYKTRNGRWASPEWEMFGRENEQERGRYPQKIPYVKPVVYPLQMFPDSTFYADEWAEIKEQYPEPFYKIENNMAITEYGAYDTALFRLAVALLDNRRITDLTINNPSWDSVQYEPRKQPRIPQLTKEEKIGLIPFLKDFQIAIHKKDMARLIELSLPMVKVCDSMYDARFFWDRKLKDINYHMALERNEKYLNQDGYYEYYLDKEIKKSEGEPQEFMFDYEGKYLQFDSLMFNTYYSYPIRYTVRDRHNLPLFAFHFVKMQRGFFLHSVAFERMRDCYGPFK